MENKYYTPLLNEVCLGFTYQTYIKDKWSEDLTIRSGEDLYSTALGFLNKKLRVKYLDREDIESLGWELHPPLSSNKLNTYKKGGEIGFNTWNLWYLSHFTSTGEVKLNHVHESSWNRGDDEMYFKIKNISELKRIMKILQIP